MSGGRAHLRERLVRWDLGGSPVTAGRVLLLIVGLVVMASVSTLHPSPSDWVVITAVSGAMLLALLVSFVVPWSTLHHGAAFVFPAAVVIGLGALGKFTTADIGSCYTGLFVLCFAYAGVYLPVHSSIPLVCFAGPALVAALDRWNPYIQIRLWIAVVIWIVLGELMALLVKHQRNVTELLQEVAATDVLTGVGTRRALDDRIASTHAGDTLVVCDLDHFKNVNDTFGHVRGDEVLRAFGAVLKGALRGDDYAGRYGGEEFVLVLADTDENEAQQVLERLRRKWLATEQGVTFSAGYQTRQEHDLPEATLAAADAALYTAKKTGRDRAIHAVARHHHDDAHISAAFPSDAPTNDI